jgi:putative transposase
MSKTKLPKTLHGKTIAGFSGDDIWLTVTDVSNLTGLNPATIREACSDRNGNYRGGRYTYRKEGKRYEILLISLPESIKVKYWLEHHNLQRSDLPVVNGNQENLPFDHETYEILADSYNRKAASTKAEAQRRVLILDEYFRLLMGGFKKEAALDIVANRHEKISRATLWRWESEVDKHPRRYWEILLVTKHVGRSRCEIPPEAWHYFRKEYGQLSEPDATVIYHETLKQAKAKGWGELPSCKTFIRRWKSDVHENEQILARKGKKALKEHLPHLKLDYNSLVIHELWESDGRIADVFCEWPDGSVSRPWVVLVREVKCRRTLAIRVYTTLNVSLVIETFRAAIIRTGTTPEEAKFDSGTEFSNHALTGGQKSPYRHAIPASEQPLGILTLMGVKIRWATPNHGQAKPMERLWNIVANYVDKYFTGAYTGRNSVERPEDCDPKKAIPIEEYLKRLQYVIEAYENGELGIVHRGHGMNGKTPAQLYEELIQKHQSRPASSAHLNMMRPMVFRRTLDRHLTFTLTIPGYGQVQYEIDNNPEVKRGYKYDIRPDAQDPKQPALVHEGMRYIGKASYKDFTPVLDENAGSEITKRRNALIKQAAAGNKAVENLVKRDSLIPVDAALASLPELPRSPLLDVLKLPKPTIPDKEDNIQIQEDGSILDTQTGEITKRNARAIFPETTIDKEAEEHERKLRELEEKTKNERLMRWKNGN